MSKQADLTGKPKNQLQELKGEGSYGGGGSGCKHAPQIRHVLTIGKAKIWAGGVADIRRAIKDGQQFQLLMCVGGPSVVSGVFEKHTDIGQGAEKMLKALTLRCGTNAMRNRLVIVDWPDFGVPPVGSAWWQALYADLSKNVTGDVAFFCHGGHGRTGTALSILAWLNGDTGEADAVGWVREKYCDHAVESASQLEYLGKLGIKTSVKGYKQGGGGDWTSKEEKKGGPAIGKWTGRGPYKTEKTYTCDVCSKKQGEYVEAVQAYVCEGCLKKDYVVAEIKKSKGEIVVEDHHDPDVIPAVDDDAKFQAELAKSKLLE